MEPRARLEHDDDGIARLTLARPEVRNAFDDATIVQLTACARSVDPSARAVVLQSEGDVFCAGADLQWMKRMATASEEENVADAGALAEMFAALDSLSMPLLARVQGAAIGGGVGLVAVCDLAIASTEASFAFREVRVGIVPAVVSPYVVRKVGPAVATALFVTGERINAGRAHEVGLIHQVVPPTSLDVALQETLEGIRAGSPQAVRTAKRLVREVVGRTPAEVRDLTVRAIASIRATPDGREGFAAFLEKRKPRWYS